MIYQKFFGSGKKAKIKKWIDKKYIINMKN